MRAYPVASGDHCMQCPGMASRRPSFPRTVVEFQRRFPTEEACEAYLAECRWPDGFACPRCGHRKAWAHVARRLRECAGCGYQVSTTAGTILPGRPWPAIVDPRISR